MINLSWWNSKTFGGLKTAIIFWRPVLPADVRFKWSTQEGRVWQFVEAPPINLEELSFSKVSPNLGWFSNQHNGHTGVFQKLLLEDHKFRGAWLSQSWPCHRVRQVLWQLGGARKIGGSMKKLCGSCGLLHSLQWTRWNSNAPRFQPKWFRKITKLKGKKTSTYFESRCKKIKHIWKRSIHQKS